MKDTHCQIEIDIHDYNDLQAIPCSGEYEKLAPLRILSFNIECNKTSQKFPTAQNE